MLTIKNLWKDIDTDPELKKLISTLKKDNNLKENKLVLFTGRLKLVCTYKELSKGFPKNSILFKSRKIY